MTTIASPAAQGVREKFFAGMSLPQAVEHYHELREQLLHHLPLVIETIVFYGYKLQPVKHYGFRIVTDAGEVVIKNSPSGMAWYLEVLDAFSQMLQLGLFLVAEEYFAADPSLLNQIEQAAELKHVYLKSPLGDLNYYTQKFKPNFPDHKANKTGIFRRLLAWAISIVQDWREPPLIGDQLEKSLRDWIKKNIVEA